jgi:hypothetical protein
MSEVFSNPDYKFNNISFLNKLFPDTSGDAPLPNCLKKIWDSILDIVPSDYSCSFLIRKIDDLELICQKGFKSDQINQICNANFIKHHLFESYSTLSSLDVEEIFGELEYRYEGIVLSVNISSLISIDKAHYLMLFLTRIENNELSQVNRNLALKIYPQSWSAILAEKLLKFRKNLSGYKQCNLELLMDLFSEADKIHPWLNNTDICKLYEITVTNKKLYDTNSQILLDIKDRIRTFGKDWHCCLERKWPCDVGVGFDANERGIINWYLWRLDNTDISFNAAIDYTNRIIKEILLAVSANSVFNNYLYKYLLLKITNNKEFLIKSTKENGPDTCIANKNNLSRFIAETLAGNLLNYDSIESVIWVLSHYAYSVLGVDKRLHIASHLRHAARGESSLHMMKDFYRDHFFHTIDVYILGQIILDSYPIRSKKNKFLKGIKNEAQLWFLASILHDIGYAIDVCDGLKDWLEFFNSGAFSSLRGQINNILTGTINEKDKTSLKMKADFEEFYKSKEFSESLDKPFKDHGLIGAYHLKSLIDNIKKHSEIESYEDSVDAISKHNCQRLKIDFGKHPLAALLVLCDTLQTWARPQFPHFSFSPSWMMSVLNHNTKEIEGPLITDSKLVTNLKFYKEDQDLIPKFNNTLILRLEYNQTVNRDSFVFNIWLDSICNLQRVDFTKLTYNIIIQIHTPTYFSQRLRCKVRQMDRLRDASSETHMAYIDDFIKITQKEKRGILEITNDNAEDFYPDEPISYYVQLDDDGNPEMELLSISLNKMNGTRQYIKNSLSRFRKDLKGWRYYYEDRLLAGDYSPWRNEI